MIAQYTLPLQEWKLHPLSDFWPCPPVIFVEAWVIQVVLCFWHLPIWLSKLMGKLGGAMIFKNLAWHLEQPTVTYLVNVFLAIRYLLCDTNSLRPIYLFPSNQFLFWICNALFLKKMHIKHIKTATKEDGCTLRLVQFYQLALLKLHSILLEHCCTLFISWATLIESCDSK